MPDGARIFLMVLEAMEVVRSEETKMSAFGTAFVSAFRRDKLGATKRNQGTEVVQD